MITTFVLSSNQINMPSTTIMEPPIESLESLGIVHSVNIHYQSTPQELIDAALLRKEGVLNDTGALVIDTGEFTGRSPKDKFIVKDDIPKDTVNWNNFNIPIEGKYFDILYKKMMDYLSSKEVLKVNKIINDNLHIYIRVGN